jgi:hypothetical protein
MLEKQQAPTWLQGALINKTLLKEKKKEAPQGKQ